MKYIENHTFETYLSPAPPNLFFLYSSFPQMTKDMIQPLVPERNFIILCFFQCYMLLLLLSCFSRVPLCATPQMAAHQAPPSLGFSKQEHWSGLPFPSPIVFLSGKSPWTESPGRVQSMDSQESDRTQRLTHHQEEFKLDKEQQGLLSGKIIIENESGKNQEGLPGLERGKKKLNTLKKNKQTKKFPK